MKSCIACGKDIPLDSRYCNACGKSQEELAIALEEGKPLSEERPAAVGLQPAPSPRGKIDATSIFVVTAIINLVILSADWIITFELGHALQRGNQAEIRSASASYELIRPWLAFQAVYALTFVYWMFKSYKVLPAISGEKNRWSTAWAIGSLFLPLVNLWTTYKVMSEIWKKSVVGPASQGSVLSWWLVTLLTTFYARLSTPNLGASKSMQELSAVFLKDCWGIFYLIGMTVWTLVIVIRISRWQVLRLEHQTSTENSRRLFM